MNVEETIALAKKGDITAIRLLGVSYSKGINGVKQDYEESKKWFFLGAEQGDAACMYLASLVCTILANTWLASEKSSVANELTFENLNLASKWALEALLSGEKEAENQLFQTYDDLGTAHYYAALGSRDFDQGGPLALDHLEKAISNLNAAYGKVDSSDCKMYLAFALHEYGKIAGYTEKNNDIEFLLLFDCVNHNYNEIMYGSTAAYYLGTMFLDGRGCQRDYDRAYEYLKMANDDGLDCSELLSHFKKKLFGGYTFAE